MLVFQVCSRETLRSLARSCSLAALHVELEGVTHRVQWRFVAISGANASVVGRALTQTVLADFPHLPASRISTCPPPAPPAAVISNPTPAETASTATMPTAIKSEYCPQPQPHAAKDPRDAQTLKANHVFSGLWLVLGSPPQKATR